MRVKSNGKKPLLMIAALALVVALSIGLTSAFLTSQQGLTNTFTPGEVSCKVHETVTTNKETGKKEKSAIVVENTGTIPAYIRVAVVANTVDAEGNITGNVEDFTFKLGDGWTKNGGYYYCNTPVVPGDQTADLLDSSITLDGVQVTVLAQAIQAHGVTDGTPSVTAVKDAWGNNIPIGN